MNQKAGNLSIYFIILLSLLSIIPILSLRFDFNNEKLLPSGDTDVEFYKEFQNQFQTQVDEEEFIFIGLQNHAGIFHQGFLKKIDSLTQYLSLQPQIGKVYSVTNSNIIFFVDSQIQARPLVHIMQPELYSNDSVYIFQSKEYREHLVSSDGKTIAVAAFCKPHLTGTEKNELLSEVEQKMNGFGFDKTHLISKVRAQKILAADLVKDGRKMIIIFVLLLGAFLFLMYRSIALMIFPIVVIIISNLLTLALFTLAGNSLDMLTSYLPLLITVASISISIPITTNYLETLKNESSRWPSMEIYKKSIRYIIHIIAFLVIGFLLVALLINVASMRIFFVFAAAGVLISSAVSILMFPVFASAISSSKLTFLKNDNPLQSGPVSRLYEMILKNKRMILFVSLLLVVVSTFFIRKIESSSLISQIPKYSAVLEDYKFMEENFSGTWPFEMVLSINNKNQSFFNLPIMTMVEEIEVFLRDSCGVGALISPLSLFRGANKAFNKGEISGFVLPSSQQQVVRFYETIMQTEHADEMQRYMLENGSRIRLSGRLSALSPGEFKIFSQKFGQFFNDKYYPNWFSYKMTGTAVLFDKTNERIEGNILIQFAVFFVMALAFCFYMFKSLKIQFLILISILIPLLTMAALAGLLDMHLKTDAVLIVAVALGILVSNTFYFLNHFKSELSQEPVLHNALKNTYLKSWKALFLTNSLLLILSFSIMLSGFESIFQAGLLLSGCIIFSLIGIMILLPAMIMTTAKSHIRILPGNV